MGRPGFGDREDIATPLARGCAQETCLSLLNSVLREDARVVRFWAKSEANLKLKNGSWGVASIFFNVNNSVFAVHSNYPFGESK